MSAPEPVPCMDCGEDVSARPSNVAELCGRCFSDRFPPMPIEHCVTCGRETATIVEGIGPLCEEHVTTHPDVVFHPSNWECPNCHGPSTHPPEHDGGSLCDDCFEKGVALIDLDPYSSPPSVNGTVPIATGSHVDGATFALDAADHVEAVWGEGHDVLWAQGEPLMIAGPDGVGKTTLGQRIALSRAGIGEPSLLGSPIRRSAKRVLYVAADRPRQAARSMHRMVSDDDRQLLTERVIVWKGALPFDLVREPARLATWIASLDCDTAVVDCLKDVAPNLSSEETGQAVNTAMQACMAAGIELTILHHQRKAQGENKRPNTLADIYGSRWLTAGCGSVLMLWGEAGDPIVECLHLKPADETVGPLTLITDTRKGSIVVQHAFSVRDLVIELGNSATTQQVTERIYGKRKVRGAEVERTRRRLDAAVETGQLRRVEPEPGEAVVYAIGSGVTEGVTHTGHAPSKEGEGADPPKSGSERAFDTDPQGSLVEPEPKPPRSALTGDDVDVKPYLPRRDDDEDERKDLR